MAIITAGTANVTTNATTVNFTGAQLVGNVVAGNIFKVNGIDAFYHVATTPTANGTLRIIEGYGGVDDTEVNFQIFTDFLEYQIAKIFNTMADSADVISRNFEVVSNKLGSLGATGFNYMQVPLYRDGEPISAETWGYLKFEQPVMLDGLTIATDEGNTDNDLTVDLTVDGTVQNINLTASAGSSSNSTTLSTVIGAGGILRVKWGTVTLPSSSNWTAHIKFHSTSPLDIHYAFNQYVEAPVLNKVIGTGFQFPVKSKVFALHYSYDDTSPSASSTIELFKNGSSFATAVEATIPANATAGRISLAQQTFLTTDVATLKFTSLATIGGNGLTLKLLSYKVS